MTSVCPFIKSNFSSSHTVLVTCTTKNQKKRRKRKGYQIYYRRFICSFDTLVQHKRGILLKKKLVETNIKFSFGRNGRSVNCVS